MHLGKDSPQAVGLAYYMVAAMSLRGLAKAMENSLRARDLSWPDGKKPCSPVFSGSPRGLVGAHLGCEKFRHRPNMRGSYGIIDPDRIVPAEGPHASRGPVGNPAQYFPGHLPEYGQGVQSEIDVTPRILIAPRPKKWGGPGIFLSRVAVELDRRGYRWTAVPFHYTGISILRWDHAFMMGCPRYKDVILGSGKPTVTTMGKPESREEHSAVGREYLPAYEKQEEDMARSIMVSGKVVFISNYVRDIWRNIFVSRGLSFPSESSVKVIYHGVEINLFSPPHEPLGLPFVLGICRQLARQDSVSPRCSLCPAYWISIIRILIVGSMSIECRKEFEKAMRDSKISERVTYVPWVDAESLPEYYRRMHCLYHPWITRVAGSF